MLLPLLLGYWLVATDAVNRSGEQAWAAAEANAAAHGIPLDGSPLRPEPVPAERNALAQPWLWMIQTEPENPEAKRLKDLSPKLNGSEISDATSDALEGKAAAGEALLSALEKAVPLLVPKAEGASSWERLYQFTENADIPWPALHSAMERPDSQVPPLGTVVDPGDLSPPDLQDSIFGSGLNRVLRFSNWRTIAALYLIKPADARRELTFQMRVVDGCLREPTLVRFLTAASCKRRIHGNIRLGILRHAWRAEDLEHFSVWLDQRNVREEFRKTLVNELNFGLRMAEWTQQHPGFPDAMSQLFSDLLSDVKRQVDTGPLKGKVTVVGADIDPARTAWWLAIQPRGYWLSLKASATASQVQRIVALEASGLHSLLDPEIAKAANFPVPSEDSGDSGLTKIVPGIIEAEARLVLARTACALELWRLRHGTWPDSLEALVPAFLPKAPLDPCSLRPLIYRLVGSNAQLISFGRDLDDDGGKPSAKDAGEWEDGDLVWTLPLAAEK